MHKNLIMKRSKMYGGKCCGKTIYGGSIPYSNAVMQSINSVQNEDIDNVMSGSGYNNKVLKDISKVQAIKGKVNNVVMPPSDERTERKFNGGTLLNDIQFNHKMPSTIHKVNPKKDNLKFSF